MSTTKHPIRSALVLLVLAASLLAACGGGGSNSSSDDGVASIDGSGSSSSGDEGTTSSADAEQELLDYVECLRGEGLDVPDPEVDADGNLSITPGGGGGPGAGDGAEIDQDAFAQAQQVCGDPPASATAGFDDIDQSEFQDAALEYAQCMRDNGIDMPDPDFSDLGNPGEGGGSGGGAGPFGDLDQDDPVFQEANDACQEAFAGVAPGDTSTTAGS